MVILILNWRDTKHPQAGGAEVHYHEIFRRLVKKGHRVILLATRFAGCTDEVDRDGITVLRWGGAWLFNWEAPGLVRRAMKRFPIDIVIDDVNKIPFFTPRYMPKIPCGAFFHHLFGKTIYELAPLPMALYVLMLERMSAWGYRNTPVCTVSKSTVDDLVTHGFDAQRITVIENSVDTDLYTPDPSVPKEPDMLLYTGRLKRYKNVGIIMDAMKMLDAEDKRVRLVIAGSGDDEPALRAQARKLGLSERVIFTGYIDEQKKIDLYRRAAIFINPSFKEGWGITCIEAGACGTAVIANNAPGLRDSVVHGKTGLLYGENEALLLAECITQLFEHPSMRASMETAGREWALNFSWDKSAERMEEWLQAILSAKRS